MYPLKIYEKLYSMNFGDDSENDNFRLPNIYRKKLPNKFKVMKDLMPLTFLNNYTFIYLLNKKTTHESKKQAKSSPIFQSSTHSSGNSMGSQESQKDIFSQRGTIMKKQNEAKKFIQ